jgi:hypothetical protein
MKEMHCFFFLCSNPKIEISILDLKLAVAGDARSLYACVEDPQSELMSIGGRGVQCREER